MRLSLQGSIGGQRDHPIRSSPRAPAMHGDVGVVKSVFVALGPAGRIRAGRPIKSRPAFHVRPSGSPPSVARAWRRPPLVDLKLTFEIYRGRLSSAGRN
jgi:hypothetical protein